MHSLEKVNTLTICNSGTGWAVEGWGEKGLQRRGYLREILTDEREREEKGREGWLSKKRELYLQKCRGQRAHIQGLPG